MGVRKFVLLLSASSTLALTIPQEEPRAIDSVTEDRRDPSSHSVSGAAPTPSNPTATAAIPAGTGSITVPANSNNTSSFALSHHANWTTNYDFEAYSQNLTVCDIFDGYCTSRDHDSDSDVEDDPQGNSQYPDVTNTTHPSVRSARMNPTATRRSVIVKRGERELAPFGDSSDAELKSWRVIPKSYYGALDYYTGPRYYWNKETFELRDENDVNDPTVVNSGRLRNTRGWVTEHPVELQVIAQFARYWGQKKTARQKAFKEQFDRPLDAAGIKFLKKEFPWGKDAVKAAGKKGITFGDVVMHVLGSKVNPGPNVLAGESINAMKEKFWSEKDARGESSRKKLFKRIFNDETTPNVFHRWNRDMMSAFEYFNHPEVKAHLVKERTELQFAFDSFADLTGGKEWKEPGITGSIGTGMGSKIDIGKELKRFLQKKVPSIESSAVKSMQQINDEAIETLEETIKQEAINYHDLKKKEDSKDPQHLAELQKDLPRYTQDLNDAKDAFDKIDARYHQVEKYLDRLALEALGFDPTDLTKPQEELSASARSKIQSEGKWKDFLKEFRGLEKQRTEAGDKVYEELVALQRLTAAGSQTRYNTLKGHLAKVQAAQAKIKSVVQVPRFDESNLGYTMSQLDIGDNMEDQFEDLDPDSEMDDCKRDGSKCTVKEKGTKNGQTEDEQTKNGGNKNAPEHGQKPQEEQEPETGVKPGEGEPQTPRPNTETTPHVTTPETTQPHTPAQVPNPAEHGP